MIQTVKYLLGIAGPSGYSSRTTAVEVALESPDLRSITALITGATSGIGFEIARVLAMRGARLVLPARSIKTAQETCERIKADFPDTEIVVLPLDLSSLSSVRTFVSLFDSLRLPLNLLINNAGKFPKEYGLSEDGFDMTFATNYLGFRSFYPSPLFLIQLSKILLLYSSVSIFEGHFLLTKLLLGKMVLTAKDTGIEGRIVNVTSGIYHWVSGDGFDYLRLVTDKKIAYDGTRVYAWSKLAVLLHTQVLAERLSKMEANVTVNCVHPGVVRTGLTRDQDRFYTDLFFFVSSFLVKSVPQAAATTIYVATSPRLAGVTGKLFSDCNETPPSKRATDAVEASKLWTLSEEMVGGSIPSPSPSPSVTDVTTDRTRRESDKTEEQTEVVVPARI